MRMVGLFATIVGTLQVIDSLFRLVVNGTLVAMNPGAGPLLVALVVVLLREARSLHLHARFQTAVRPNGRL